ncbi:hypothetical protein AB4374_21815 [Vibrio splendidus]
MIFSLKKFTFIVILSIALLATNSYGFDLYFHTLSSFNFSSIGEINFSLSIFGFDFSRYILFHQFLVMTSYLGFPPVITIALLQSFVITLLFQGGDKVFISLLAKVSISIVGTFFWSPASLVIICVVTLLSNKKHDKYTRAIYCICVSIHFLGLMLGLLYLIKSKDRFFLFFITIVVLVISHLTTGNAVIQCPSIIRSAILDLSFDSILDRVKYKVKELIILLFLLIIVYKSPLKNLKITGSNIISVYIIAIYSIALFLLLVVSWQVYGYKLGPMSESHEMLTTLRDYSWFNLKTNFNVCEILRYRQ